MMGPILTMQHVSTWNLGWQFVALVLPPFLFACYRYWPKHRGKFVAGLMLLIGIGICTAMADVHNYWSTPRFWESQPRVYPSAEALCVGLVVDSLVFVFSTFVTGLVWVAYVTVNWMRRPPDPVREWFLADAADAAEPVPAYEAGIKTDQSK